MVKKRLNKIKLGIKSVLITCKYKLQYGDALKMGWMNSIRGKLHIEMNTSSNMVIGKFLMSRGPLYLKCTDNAQLVIGDRCFFNNNCSVTCSERVEIGNNCMFANNLVIVDHDHRITGSLIEGNLTAKPVIIGDNVWIGANVTILKGVTIGDGAVIAAGAVINENVPPHSMAGGVPARLLKQYAEVDIDAGKSGKFNKRNRTCI